MSHMNLPYKCFLQILYGFLQAFFISKETPTAERRHIEEVEGGERDTLVVHRNEAAVAWPEAIACHRPRR